MKKLPGDPVAEAVVLRGEPLRGFNIFLADLDSFPQGWISAHKSRLL